MRFILILKYKYLKFLLLLFIVLISSNAYSQKNRTLLNGKIKSNKNDVSNILIVNLNSEKSTITDSLGLFTIEVKLRDSLRITAVQYLTKEIIITATILNEKILILDLVDNVISLEEVTVTPYNLTGKIDLDIERLGLKPVVTSSTLGLQNANIDPMTQSERLLLEADRGQYVYYYGIAAVINLHKVLNKVSGRTKSFEEMVERDENTKFEKEIISKFSKETISDGLDIPLKDIDGFLTYCLSQKDFSELSQSDNFEQIWEYLKGKSFEFKEPDYLKEQ